MLATLVIRTNVIVAAAWGTGLGYALAKRSKPGLIVVGIILIIWLVQAADPGLLACHNPEGCPGG